jgi:hypothetical protein
VNKKPLFLLHAFPGYLIEFFFWHLSWHITHLQKIKADNASYYNTVVPLFVAIKAADM